MVPLIPLTLRELCLHAGIAKVGHNPVLETNLVWSIIGAEIVKR